jgi:hypothetical protein
MQNIFDWLDKFQKRKVHPYCKTRGNMCVHCETEAAERAAFVISELLSKRAKELVEKSPEISKELMQLATDINHGSWYQDYDAATNS